MIVIAWLRTKLFGPHDPVKLVIFEKIDKEVSKLNGATQHLAETVNTIERTRSRQSMPDMLDDALRAMDREHRQ